MNDIAKIGAVGLDGLHLGGLVLLLGLGALMIWARGAYQRELDRRTSELLHAEERAESALQELRTQRAMADQARMDLAALKGRKQEDEAKFAELASQVLGRANEQFLQLANQTFEKHQTTAKGNLEKLMQPVDKSFQDFRERVDAIEKTRTAERSALAEQIRIMSADLDRHRTATGKLVTALSAPKGGGRWGETTLRNVMEHAGLSAYCDFDEQVSSDVGEGKIRPDVVIRLPGGREIVVDAKVSLEAYLQAADEDDPALRAAHLKAHARNVREQIRQLGSKSYQDSFSGRIDFVAMFIPGENFYMAALEHEPDLFDYAAARQVIVTTPSTLLALAKAVAYGWRQERATENAREAAKLGRELYERLVTMGANIEKLGKSINSVVTSYNAMNGSLRSRVLPTARKFQELEIADPAKTVTAFEPVEDLAALPDRTGELQFDDDAA